MKASVCKPSTGRPAARELRLQTAHVEVAARIWDSPGGQPVLALHGWLDNAASFDPLAPLLPGWQLAALDLPGHGLSSHRPPGIHYHFVDFVADVLAAADQLGWEHFSLLGHSLGAGVATFVAAVAPRRVQRVMLIDGLGPLSADPVSGPDDLAESIQQMARMEDGRGPVYHDLQEAARARHRAGDLGFESALVLAQRGLRQDGRVWRWRSDPKLRVRSPHYLSEPQVLAYLRRIEAPVHLLLARQGHLTERDWSVRRAAVANLEVTEVDGGHHLHMDHPQAVAGILAGCL